MTCAEFESKYPEIAEGDNEVSNQAVLKKSHKIKTAQRPSQAGDWSRESFEELKEKMQLDSDEAEEIDESSSYRA